MVYYCKILLCQHKDIPDKASHRWYPSRNSLCSPSWAVQRSLCPCATAPLLPASLHSPQACSVAPCTGWRAAHICWPAWKRADVEEEVSAGAAGCLGMARSANTAALWHLWRTGAVPECILTQTEAIQQQCSRVLESQERWLECYPWWICVCRWKYSWSSHCEMCGECVYRRAGMEKPRLQLREFTVQKEAEHKQSLRQGLTVMETLRVMELIISLLMWSSSTSISIYLEKSMN